MPDTPSGGGNYLSDNQTPLPAERAGVHGAVLEQVSDDVDTNDEHGLGSGGDDEITLEKVIEIETDAELALNEAITAQIEKVCL